MFTAILASSPWWGPVAAAALEAAATVVSGIFVYDVVSILVN